MPDLSFCLMSPKGGVGKSTTALLLASEIIRHDKTVTIIEADGNQHLKRWHDLGNCPDHLSLVSIGSADASDLEHTAFRAADTSDYIIFDTQGTENAAALRAAALSDVVLLPSAFSPFEVQGAMTALNAVRSLPGDIAPSLTAVIFTRVNAAIKTRAQSDILASFDELAIPYIWPGLLDKEACRQMLKHGCLLHDLPLHTNVSGIQNAIDNIQAVLRAILARLTQEHPHG